MLIYGVLNDIIWNNGGICMESFFVSFNAVAPLASYILIGIFLKKMKMVQEDFLKTLNNLLFRAFFPVVIFSNIYATDFSASADMGVIIYLIIFIVSLVIFMMLAVPHFIKSRATCGAFVQASYRSNLILFGVHLTESVFGEGSTGMISVACAFIVPLYNVLAVIILEYFRGESTNAKKLIKNILKNPLIRGALAGAAFNLLHLPAPAFFQSVVKSASNGTTVFALIVLGASLQFSSMAKNIRYITADMLLRLFIVPLAAVSLGYAIGFRDMQLFTILIVTATPVAASSYTMAQSMESDHVLSAQLVAISTVLSVFTMFGWIMAFFALGIV
jgi:predicted permease